MQFRFMFVSQRKTDKFLHHIQWVASKNNQLMHICCKSKYKRFPHYQKDYMKHIIIYEETSFLLGWPHHILGKASNDTPPSIECHLI